MGCVWLQLDHDEEMGPMHGMYGTLDAELEEQRTINGAELTVFFVPPQESYRSHYGSY